VRAKRVIVLRITDPDRFVSRQAKSAQCDVEAGGFVDARWKQHHCRAVEDGLQLESELPDNFEHGRAMTIVRGDQDLSDLDGIHAALDQSFDKVRRNSRRERDRFSPLRIVEDAAVLRDSEVEYSDPRAHAK
jgi:hypothetical protein